MVSIIMTNTNEFCNEWMLAFYEETKEMEEFS